MTVTVTLVSRQLPPRGLIRPVGLGGAHVPTLSFGYPPRQFILVGIVCNKFLKKKSFIDSVTAMLVPTSGLLRCDRMNRLPKYIIDLTAIRFDLPVDTITI